MFCLGCPREPPVTQRGGSRSRQHNFYPNLQGQVRISCSQAVLKIITHPDVDSGNETRALSCQGQPCSLQLNPPLQQEEEGRAIIGEGGQWSLRRRVVAGLLVETHR